jgi:hypothetical protein
MDLVEDGDLVLEVLLLHGLMLVWVEEDFRDVAIF